jgi:ABC-type sugar transport system ATPase subunit
MTQSSTSTLDPPLLLEMRGIVKSFPGVKALQGVDLDLGHGEVLALLGENGAGKSTLMKFLGGAHLPDEGSIILNGSPISIQSPADSQRAGIAVIYQEFNLVPGLSARENIFLGHEPVKRGFIDAGEERRRTLQLFEQLGVVIDPDIPCRRLTVAQQQIVEIAKALCLEARILVMDEPSATLTTREVERLFGIIRDLKSRGISVIYISHRLEEIFSIADQVTVLRDGANVGHGPVKDLTRSSLIQWMVGRDISEEFPPRSVELGPARLKVQGLCRGETVRNVSFDIRAGEILALTGLIGAGRTETARLVFGADRRDAGLIELDGRPLPLKNPREAIAAGIAFLTEDRKTQGLVLNHSVRDNFGLPNLDWLCRSGFVRLAEEREKFGSYVKSLQIKVPHQEQAARNLSGGNQQKVVLAKWLARECEVLIFDEPTRGIDVGAKIEIYHLINDLAAQGKAILMISSELPEVLGMADRILVMHDGRITGEFTDVAGTSQEQIMELAVA